jgi:hypothetical protein
MLLWGLQQSEHSLESPWVQLPLTIVFPAFAGYMLGRLFGS